MRKKILATAVGLALAVGGSATYMATATAGDAPTVAASAATSTLTVKVIGLNGKPAWAYLVNIFNTDDMTRYNTDDMMRENESLGTNEQGVMTRRVPKGNYFVSALIDGFGAGGPEQDKFGNQVTHTVINPAVTVNGTTTITLDARTTQAIRQRVGTTYTTPRSTWLSGKLVDAKGKSKEIILGGDTGTTVHVNRVGTTRSGTFTALFRQRTVSAQASNRFYTTINTSTGVPNTVFTMNPAKAAKVNVSLKSATGERKNWSYSIIRARHLAGWNNGFRKQGRANLAQHSAQLSDHVKPHSTWTEYLYPAGNKWYTQIYLDNPYGAEFGTFQTPVQGKRYEPGSVHTEKWLADSGKNLIKVM